VTIGPWWIDEIAEPQSLRQGSARTDAQQPPRAEADQLVDHDRGAGTADPGALDRERLAVGRKARVTPQAAIVVEHLGAVEQ